MIETAGYFFALGPDGDHLDEVAKWTNWAHVSHLTPRQAESLPERAQALGLKISYGGMETFFQPGSVYKTRPDWRARWDRDTVAGRSLAKRLLDAGVLHSVYVADEPRGNGLARSDVEAVLEVVGAEFPTFIVEDATTSTLMPPEGVTYYGLSCWTPATLKTAAARYAALRAKWPGQIIVVAQAFNERPHAVPDQAAWFQLAREVPDAVGLAWFLYPSYVQNGRKYLGSVGAPSALALHRQQGAAIKAAGGRMTILPGRRYFADVNGDGKAELVVQTESGDIHVYSDTERLIGPRPNGAWTYGYGYSYTLSFANVNGQGGADLISEHPTEGLQVGLSTGAGFESPVQWGDAPWQIS